MALIIPQHYHLKLLPETTEVAIKLIKDAFQERLSRALRLRRVTALCGPIAFIGLAVPHAARLLLRTADHRRLLLATLLLGADVALLALILTHLPGERGVLPLAALTPLIGVPVVLYILLRRG